MRMTGGSSVKQSQCQLSVNLLKSMLINSQIVLMPFLVSFISLLNMYIEEEVVQSEKRNVSCVKRVPFFLSRMTTSHPPKDCT